MNNGCSGAKFKILDNTKILKYYDTVNTSLYDQYLWLKTMLEVDSKHFPKIYDWCIVGYEMANLEHFCALSDASKNNFTNINSLFKELTVVLDTIQKTKISKPEKFETFLFRIIEHIKKIKHYKSIQINKEQYDIFDSDLFLAFFFEKSNIFDKEFSNCHGDLTLENIFVHDDELYLIDSNYLYNKWNSWLLDIAKLYQSLKSNYEIWFELDFNFNYKIIDNSIFVKYEYKYEIDNSNYISIIENNIPKIKDYKKELLLFEICNYIRMLKYKKTELDYIKAYTMLTILYNKLLKGNYND